MASAQAATGTITITAQPGSISTTAGSVSGTITVLATVSDESTLTYQWYEATTNTNVSGTTISGATNRSFNLPISLQAGSYYYYCVISSETCASVKTQAVTVTVEAGTATISISAQPNDATVTADAISGSLHLTAAASDGSTLSYQWYGNTTDSNTGGTLVSGATSASLALPTDLTEGSYYYYCVVSASGLTAVTSETAAVTVLAEGTAIITITANPGEQTFALNTGSAGISVVASASDGSTLSYQWYANTTDSNTGGSAITGATSLTYTVPTDTAGTFYYYCVIGSATAASVTSGVATVTVE
ncbi:MAG TPA: hypothetical protein PKC96_07355 [Bacilli bacterium]|nr:hypothetical protein [Bacilli bacterium]